jgi:hypothetical protein
MSKYDSDLISIILGREIVPIRNGNSHTTTVELPNMACSKPTPATILRKSEAVWSYCHFLGGKTQRVCDTGPDLTVQVLK